MLVTVGRWMRRHAEIISVLAGGVLLSIVMNWPLATQMDTTIPSDPYDPLHQAWSLMWPGYALFHGDASLWDGNIFAGEHDAYAYADTLLGLAPFGFFGSGTTAALIGYNTVFLLSAALTSIGGYALLRQLGSHWSGAMLAGIALAYAPWRLAHDGHLNILFSGIIFLALFALARGHGFTLDKNPERSQKRPRWIVAGWLLACWQLTTGFTMGIAIAYFLAGTACVAVIMWFIARRPRLPVTVLYADGVGIAIYLFTAAVMVRPYLRILDRYPDATKDREFFTDFFSPPVSGLFTASGESWLWGSAHAGARSGMEWPSEMTLFMGMAVILAGLIGVVYSAWSRHARIWLSISAVLTCCFALGTTFFEGTYTIDPLRALPGWDTLRTPGRFIFWTTLIMAVLAAGALTKLAQNLSEHLKGRGKYALALAMLIPALIATLEGVAVRDYPEVPQLSAAAAQEMRDAEETVAVLGVSDHTAMFWSTEGFPPLLNGASSFNPPSRAKRLKILKNFPNFSSVQYLREQNVSTVIVARNSGGGQTLARSSPELGLSAKVYPQVVVYTLSSS